MAWKLSGRPVHCVQGVWACFAVSPLTSSFLFPLFCSLCFSFEILAAGGPFLLSLLDFWLVSSPSLHSMCSGSFVVPMVRKADFPILNLSALRLLLNLLLFWGIPWGCSLPLSLGFGLSGSTYWTLVLCLTLWVLLCFVCVWEGFLPPLSSNLGFPARQFFLGFSSLFFQVLRMFGFRFFVLWADFSVSRTCPSRFLTLSLLGFVLHRYFDFLLQLEVCSVSPEVLSSGLCGDSGSFLFLPFSVEIEDHGWTGVGLFPFLGLVPFVFIGLSAPWGEFSQLGRGFSPFGGFPGFSFQSGWPFFSLSPDCRSWRRTVSGGLRFAPGASRSLLVTPVSPQVPSPSLVLMVDASLLGWRFVLFGHLVGVSGLVFSGFFPSSGLSCRCFFFSGSFFFPFLKRGHLWLLGRGVFESLDSFRVILMSLRTGSSVPPCLVRLWYLVGFLSDSFPSLNTLQICLLASLRDAGLSWQ